VHVGKIINKAKVQTLDIIKILSLFNITFIIPFPPFIINQLLIMLYNNLYMDFVSDKLIIAIIVLVVIVAYWAFNFIVFYHLTRFGIGTQPKKFAAVFLLGSVILFFISATFFASLDLNSLKNQLGKLGNNIFNITYQK
jgi:hypothetical protein